MSSIISIKKRIENKLKKFGDSSMPFKKNLNTNLSVPPNVSTYPNVMIIDEIVRTKYGNLLIKHNNI